VLKKNLSIILIINLLGTQIYGDPFTDIVSSKDTIINNIDALQKKLDPEKNPNGPMNQIDIIQNTIKAFVDYIQKTILVDFPAKGKQLYSDVTDEIKNNINLIITDAKNTADAQAPVVSNEINQLQIALNSIADKFVNDSQDILTYITSFTPETILNFVIDPNTGTLKDDTTLANDIVNSAITKEKDLETKIENFNNKVLQAIDTNIKTSTTLANELKNKYIQLGKNELDKATQLFESIKKYLNEIATRVKSDFETINNAFDQIRADTTAILTNLRDTFQGVNTMLGAIETFVFDGYIESIIDDFKSDVASTIDILNGFIKGGVPSISDVFNIIVNLFKGIFNDIKTNKGQGIANIVASILTAIDSNKQKIQDLTNIPTNFQKDVDAVIENAKNQSKNGTINSFKNLFGEIIQTITDVTHILGSGIDVIESFNRNIHVELLSSATLLALKQLNDELIPALRYQIKKISDNQEKIATHIGIMVVGYIATGIVLLALLKYGYSEIKAKVKYSLFEDKVKAELKKRGFSDSQISEAFKNIPDEETFDSLQDKFLEATKDTTKIDDFVREAAKVFRMDVKEVFGLYQEDLGKSFFDKLKPEEAIQTLKELRSGFGISDKIPQIEIERIVGTENINQYVDLAPEFISRAPFEQQLTIENEPIFEQLRPSYESFDILPPGFTPIESL